MDNVVHKQKWKILELFIALHSILAIILQFFIPIKTSSLLMRIILLIVGLILFISSILLVIRSRKEFRIFSQPTDPGFETTKLIMTGPFKLSRNPLSVATIGILISVGLISNNNWFLILIIITIPMVYGILIKPEEAYLKEKFGKIYTDYLQKVPRWLL